MKSSGQAKDGAIDNLLRAYVSRPSNPHQVCPDFDPDQANAYIERGLTGSSRTKYEQHLSECGPCRKSVVALMRLAEADSQAAISAVRVPVSATPSWLDGVRRMLGALAQPRWAMAATAIIVAAISLPLILSRSEVRDSTNAVADQVASNSEVRSVAPATREDERKSGDAPALVAATRQQRESNVEKTQLVAKNEPVPTAAATTVDLLKKAEEKSAAEPTDEAKRKSESQVAGAPAAAAGTQVARGDSDQNRQQQQAKDSGPAINRSTDCCTRS